MSKINGKTETLLSRVALSGLALIAVSAMSIGPASAQVLKRKSEVKSFELKSDAFIAKNNGDAELNTKKPNIFFSVNTKGDREEGGSGKKVFPKAVISKGDRDEDEPKTQQIVIGKGDQAEENERPVKRQVIVEAKPKRIAEAEPVVLAKPKKKVAGVAKPKKTVVAAVEEPELQSIADAAPAEDAPVIEEQVETEAPATEEAPITEEAEAPKQKFEVGQIVTAADGNSYVVVKVNEKSVSVMPLSAYVSEEPVYKAPTKKYKKSYKKRRAYSTYRSYGGYSGCN